MSLPLNPSLHPYVAFLRKIFSPIFLKIRLLSTGLDVSLVRLVDSGRSTPLSTLANIHKLISYIAIRAQPTIAPPPRLPIELARIICRHLAETEQKVTLATMMRLSTDIYDIAARALYQRVTLSKENAESFFSGLAIAISPADLASGEPTPLGPSRVDIYERDEFGKSPLLAWVDLPNNPCRLKWPDVDCTTHDETPEGLKFEVDRYPITRTVSQRYPTIRSHSRKFHLLRLVEHLTINSPFRPELAQRVLPVLSFIARRHGGKRQERLLSSATTVVIKTGVLVETANWESRRRRHCMIGITHPFCTMFKALCNPEHICVDNTLWITKEEWFHRRERFTLEQSFSHIATRGNDIIPGRAGEDYEFHREAFFESEWASFHHQLLVSFSAALLSGCSARLQIITYHNADGGGPIAAKDVMSRMFFSRTDGLGISPTSVLDEPRLRLPK